MPGQLGAHAPRSRRPLPRHSPCSPRLVVEAGVADGVADVHVRARSPQLDLAAEVDGDIRRVRAIADAVLAPVVLQRLQQTRQVGVRGGRGRVRADRTQFVAVTRVRAVCLLADLVDVPTATLSCGRCFFGLEAQGVRPDRPSHRRAKKAAWGGGVGGHLMCACRAAPGQILIWPTIIHCWPNMAHAPALADSARHGCKKRAPTPPRPALRPSG